MAQLEPGTLVRFNHERDGGPVRRVASVAPDGMVEIEDMGGFFAPHLFEIADDIEAIPPNIDNDLCQCPACGRMHRHLGFGKPPQPIGLPADILEHEYRKREGLTYDYRCDCCDNGLNAEWDFCPFCGKIQREEPSGLCLAGLAANKACRPDDTLKRCTICGFVVDTQYAAEKPTQ